jgi:pSer/pThr/pTyr-binding forkhead associated (FHA) protein
MDHPPDAPQRANVTLSDPSGRVVSVPLSPRAAPLSVGRSRRADIALVNDAAVSGAHAELLCIAGVWVIVDDGLSTNGTFVCGERLRGRRRLRDGDRVRLGRSDLIFHQPLPSDPSDHTPELQTARQFARLGPDAREVMAELSRPLRLDRRGLAATDTEIAAAMGVTLAAVTEAVTELCAWFGLTRIPVSHARHRLAAIAVQHVPHPAAGGGA